LVISAEPPDESDEIREEPLLRPWHGQHGYRYMGGATSVTMTLRRLALAPAFMLVEPDEPR